VAGSIYDISATAIDGTNVPLDRYRGQVLLVVNVASKCGFTPQYAGLEALYRKYRDRGFTILGFPCNQFGAQEAGTDAEIASFCSLNYDVTFPLFAKVDVNGEHAHPLFQLLKKERKGLLGTESIKWNFTKFLVSRDGQVVDRFGSSDPPEKIEPAISSRL
jgi:glutathione peroxidase